MYLEHFGLREAPFRITPQIEYFFAGARRGALLDALMFAVEHDEGIIVVTGEVGVGKTMLCRMLLDRLPDTTVTLYLTNPSLRPQELLETLALELGVNGQGAPSLLRAIEERLIALYAEGRRVLTIIDEAHAMPRESLELVRLLSNLESPSRKLLQIALFAQPELTQLLAEPAMRSLRERITQRFDLAPLDAPDIGQYLHFRLFAAGYRGPDLFAGPALRTLATAAEGLVRRVNIIADKALLAAFADDTRNVGERHVRRAIDDAGYRPPRRQRVAIAVAGAVLLAISGSIVWSLYAPRATSSAPAATPAQPLAVAASAPVLTANPPSASQPVAVETAPVSLALGKLGGERLAAIRPLLAQTPSSHWFIQLQTSSPPDAIALEDFLAHAARDLDRSRLYVYASQIGDRSRIGVIYGDYADSATANAAVAALPEWIRRAGAYPRRFSALQGTAKPGVAP